MAVYFQNSGGGKHWTDYIGEAISQLAGGYINNMFQKEQETRAYDRQREMMLEEQKQKEIMRAQNQAGIDGLGFFRDDPSGMMKNLAYLDNLGLNTDVIARAAQHFFPHFTQSRFDAGGTTYDGSFDPFSGKSDLKPYQHTVNPTNAYVADKQLEGIKVQGANALRAAQINASSRGGGGGAPAVRGTWSKPYVMNGKYYRQHSGTGEVQEVGDAPQKTMTLSELQRYKASLDPVDPRVPMVDAEIDKLTGFPSQPAAEPQQAPEGPGLWDSLLKKGAAALRFLAGNNQTGAHPRLQNQVPIQPRVPTQAAQPKAAAAPVKQAAQVNNEIEQKITSMMKKSGQSREVVIQYLKSKGQM